MVLGCCVYSPRVEIRSQASDGAGGHVADVELLRVKERQRVEQRWPEQWNNVLIYLRSEQWPVCFLEHAVLDDSQAEGQGAEPSSAASH